MDPATLSLGDLLDSAANLLNTTNPAQASVDDVSAGARFGFTDVEVLSTEVSAHDKLMFLATDGMKPDAGRASHFPRPAFPADDTHLLPLLSDYKSATLLDAVHVFDTHDMHSFLPMLHAGDGAADLYTDTRLHSDVTSSATPSPTSTSPHFFLDGSNSLDDGDVFLSEDVLNPTKRPHLAGHHHHQQQQPLSPTASLSASSVSQANASSQRGSEPQGLGLSAPLHENMLAMGFMQQPQQPQQAFPAHMQSVSADENHRPSSPFSASLAARQHDLQDASPSTFPHFAVNTIAQTYNPPRLSTQLAATPSSSSLLAHDAATKRQQSHHSAARTHQRQKPAASKCNHAGVNNPLVQVADVDRSFDAVLSSHLLLNSNGPALPYQILGHALLAQPSRPVGSSTLEKSAGARTPTTTNRRKGKTDEKKKRVRRTTTGFVCACCKGTETPMWRDGPDKKKLCNACGIRWQKYGAHCNQCMYIPRKSDRADGVCTKCQHTLTIVITSRSIKHQKAMQAKGKKAPAMSSTKKNGQLTPPSSLAAPRNSAHKASSGHRLTTPGPLVHVAAQQHHQQHQSISALHNIKNCISQLQPLV